MTKSKPAGARNMTAAQAAELQGAPDLVVKHLEEGKIFEPRNSEVDTLTTAGEPWEARAATGKKLRDYCPRDSHGKWQPEKARPDPVKLVLAANSGRLESLIPLRMQRMAASPFAFLRGSAAVMAWDLAHAPSMGLDVVIDGDCHIDNFGLFGTPQNEVVLDMNDFDETTIGPWEWDIKRLAASINLAGRQNGLSRKQRKKAAISVAARSAYLGSLLAR